MKNVIPDSRWPEVEALLDRALDLPAEERMHLVASIGAGDAELARALAALLEAADGESALDRPVASLAPGLVAAASEAAEERAELAPGAQLGAYRILSRIGAGGMGQVYLAERADGQFERRVALKVLGAFAAGPGGRERFQRERQTLADLRHENIAQLLDAGVTDDGRPFFVLEYVDGAPVTDFCREHGLGREERIALVLQACRALAHAHERGVVHRDLKPANLLVASGDEGGLRLFVLDFGIARTAGALELTHVGDVIGTPGYMSPEQARGEVETVDRRADVFALGVLLYELLCERRPFAGETPAEVLGAVLSADPPSPRTLVPDMPRDLETIVSTCLEKYPMRRYPSVQALAADLARYLADEPIAARRPGVVRRATRSARRRPLVTGALLALLASGTVGAAVAVREQRVAQVRAEVARRFGAEAERVAALLRFEHLAPLHDTAPARERLVAHLAALERELAESDPAARASGRLALGRGRLALGDFELALADLEAAWQGGARTTEAALALAAAEAERYRRERQETDRLADPVLREARLTELDRRSRDRALELAELAHGGAVGAEGDLVRARIAFLEGDFEAAGKLADAALAAAPWLYEAGMLAGDVELARMGELRRAGDLAALGAPLERGLAAYRAAAVVGASDPEAHLRLCGAAVSGLDLALHAIESGPERLASPGRAACRAAALADGKSAAPLVQASALETVYARELSRRDLDPFPATVAAVAAAEGALALEPNSARALRRLGDALAFRAEFEREWGIDSASSIAASTAALERATALAPEDPGAWNGLGLAHWEAVFHAAERGADAAPAARAAIGAFSRAVDLEPGYAYAWGNLGSMHNKLAEAAMRASEDPAPALEDARRAFEQALAIYPEYATAVNNLGNVLYNLGEVARQRGGEATEEFARAREQFDRAAVLKPDWFVPRVNQARAGLALARTLVRAGAAPDEALARTVSDLEAGLARRSTHVQVLVLASEIYLFQAEIERTRSRSAAEPLRRTREVLARLRTLDRKAGAEVARGLTAFERGEPTGLDEPPPE